MYHNAGPHKHKKPYVLSKGRKFERARGRRKVSSLVDPPSITFLLFPFSVPWLQGIKRAERFVVVMGYGSQDTVSVHGQTASTDCCVYQPFHVNTMYPLSIMRLRQMLIHVCDPKPLNQVRCRLMTAENRIQTRLGSNCANLRLFRTVHANTVESTFLVHCRFCAYGECAAN